MHEIQCKRVYESPADGDGERILVDRLWPRGMRKEDARIDLWARGIAPSPALRTWFAHDPERFEAFSAQYVRELEANAEAAGFLHGLLQALESRPVTFLYAAKDTEHNHAAVLKRWAEKRLRGQTPGSL